MKTEYGVIREIDYQTDPENSMVEAYRRWYAQYRPGM